MSVIASVRYQQLTVELQVDRDALQASSEATEVQLQQQTADIQQLHDKVHHNSIAHCTFGCFCCARQSTV